MTSFIEIPQLAFNGRETLPVYINIADIISVASDYDRGTVFRVRDLGSEGTATFKTYLPLGMILDVLGELARFPGVRSWADSTKDAFRIPAQERARALAEKSRHDDCAYPEAHAPYSKS
jgi:hypothetical protein